MKTLMLFQVIPAGGKTFLSRAEPEVYVDSDDVMTAFMGEASKVTFDRIIADEGLTRAFASLLESRSPKIVLCNFDPETLGLPCARRFAYKASDYVRHIRQVGRKDLLTNFDPSTLRSWAEDYSARSNVSWMSPGTFVSDYV